MGRNGTRKAVEVMIVVIMVLVLINVVQVDHPSPSSIISPNCFSSPKPCEDGKHVNRKRCTEMCKKACAEFRIQYGYRACVGDCKKLCLKGVLRGHNYYK